MSNQNQNKKHQPPNQKQMLQLVGILEMIDRRRQQEDDPSIGMFTERYIINQVLEEYEKQISNS